MLSLKTITIGKSTVGKTSIITRLLYGHCDEKVFATIGVSFFDYTYQNIRYQVWDTAGQERFHSLTPMYIREARIIIFVFDVTDITTLNFLNKYLPDLVDIDNYLIIVVGNKIDLIDDNKLNEIIDSTEIKIKEFPVYQYIFDYVFISAKTGENFNRLLEKLSICGKIFEDNKNNNDIISYKPLQLVEREKEVEESRCQC